MNKKIPWWRKPYDDEDTEEGSDNDRNRDHGKMRRLDGRDFDDDFERFFGPSLFRDRRDIFMDFEHEFEEMHHRMDRVFKQAVDGKMEKPGKGGPFVYGFSMRTGPDGVPHVQEFGNISPEMMHRFKTSNNMSLPGPGEIKTETSDHALPSREPLTDIMEHDDHITITLELPGVEKKDINLEIENDALVVDVDTTVRKYFKKLPLPTEVEPKSIDASFNNGVLDVNVKRLKAIPKKGKKIEIK